MGPLQPRVACVAHSSCRGIQSSEGHFWESALHKVPQADEYNILQTHRRYRHAACARERQLSTRYLFAEGCIRIVTDTYASLTVCKRRDMHLRRRASGKLFLRSPATSTGTTPVLKHPLSCAATRGIAAESMSGLGPAVSATASWLRFQSPSGAHVRDCKDVNHQCHMVHKASSPVCEMHKRKRDTLRDSGAKCVLRCDVAEHGS